MFLLGNQATEKIGMNVASFSYLCLQSEAFFITNVQYTIAHDFFWKWLEPEFCTS
jgi:hypothetical protein